MQHCISVSKNNTKNYSFSAPYIGIDKFIKCSWLHKFKVGIDLHNGILPAVLDSPLRVVRRYGITILIVHGWLVVGLRPIVRMCGLGVRGGCPPWGSFKVDLPRRG